MAQEDSLEYIGRATKDYAANKGVNPFPLRHLIRSSGDMAAAQGANSYKYGRRFARKVVEGTVPAPAGTSLFFDGSLAQVLDSPYQMAASGNGHTVSVWIRVDPSATDVAGFLSDNVSDYMAIKNADSEPWQIEGRVNNTANSIDTSASYMNNTWYHVVITKDNSGSGGDIYMNAVDDATGTANYGAWTCSHLGVRTGDFRYLTGWMTQLTFMDKVLSAPEVTELYNAGVPVADMTAVSFAANVKRWYKLGEGDTESTLVDTIRSVSFARTPGIVTTTEYPS